MQLLPNVLSFAAVAGLVTIVPGLDTAMALHTSVAQGRRRGLATALGVNTGALVWGAGAALGVSALLTASTDAYMVLRIAGAVYMVWLGSRWLVSAFGTGRGGEPALPVGGARAPRLMRSWSRGLMTNLLNPKVGAFYVAVLPQFIPARASHVAVGLLLAAVHDLEALVWFSAIILGAHSFRSFLQSRRARRALDAAAGATLIGFGLKLGLSSR